MPLSFRASVGVKTTSGTGTITLNSTNLNLTTDHTCLGVFEYGIRWDDGLPMRKKAVKEIDYHRENKGTSGSGDPTIYALHRISDVLTLELWPAPSETIDDFDDAKLKLDIVERSAAINVDTDCVLPAYSHDMIVMLAAYRIMGDVEPEKRFLYRTKDRFRPGDLDLEERVVKSKANGEASGIVPLGISIIR